jgi:hypothetical protein
MTRALTLAGYAAVVVLAAGVEVAARRGLTATFGEALSSWLRRPAVRLVVLAGWLWLGWHLFVRVDWR